MFYGFKLQLENQTNRSEIWPACKVKHVSKPLTGYNNCFKWLAISCDVDLRLFKHDDASSLMYIYNCNASNKGWSDTRHVHIVEHCRVNNK